MLAISDEPRAAKASTRQQGRRAMPQGPSPGIRPPGLSSAAAQAAENRRVYSTTPEQGLEEVDTQSSSEEYLETSEKSTPSCRESENELYVVV